VATPAVTQALRVPGKLSYGPSDLTSAYPHGGTGLGLVRDIRLTRDVVAERRIRATEYGGETVEALVPGQEWVISFLLRGFDNDAISTVFPNTFTGATDSLEGIREPGTIRAGELLSDQAVVKTAQGAWEVGE